jgi:hypothetical protein
MLSVILESPYGSSNSIGVQVKEITENGERTIADDNMEEQGLFAVRRLKVEMGKYSITFYDAADPKKKAICGTFSATVLIENKPFDFMTKVVSENYESCPLLHLPESLNIPGWLSGDTFYILNLMNRFKVKSDIRTIKFNVPSTSIFKLMIPDEHSCLFSYIALYNVKNSNRIKIERNKRRRREFDKHDF